jgi:hypothetical protein
MTINNAPARDSTFLKKLLATTALMFGARLALTIGDPAYLCGVGTTYELIITLIFDALLLVVTPIVVTIYRELVSPRMRAVGIVLPLLSLAVYEIVRNPCILSFLNG